MKIFQALSIFHLNLLLGQYGIVDKVSTWWVFIWSICYLLP